MSGRADAAALLISVFFSMNLLLFVLNMIPVPPLDGSGAILLFLGPQTAERYQTFMAQPMFGWAGIVIAWLVFGKIFGAIFLLSVNLLYPEVGYG